MTRHLGALFKLGQALPVLCQHSHVVTLLGQFRRQVPGQLVAAQYQRVHTITPVPIVPATPRAAVRHGHVGARSVAAFVTPILVAAIFRLAPWRGLTHAKGSSGRRYCGGYTPPSVPCPTSPVAACRVFPELSSLRAGFPPPSLWPAPAAGLAGRSPASPCTFSLGRYSFYPA